MARRHRDDRRKLSELVEDRPVMAAAAAFVVESSSAAGHCFSFGNTDAVAVELHVSNVPRIVYDQQQASQQHFPQSMLKNVAGEDQRVLIQ